MDIPFLQQFLLISDIRTILFLILLAAGFYLIHILYHKKHLDFSVVVLIGTGLGLLLGLAVQAASAMPHQYATPGRPMRSQPLMSDASALIAVIQGPSERPPRK